MASLLALIDCTYPFVVKNVVVYPSRVSPVYEVVLDSSAAVEHLVKDFFKFTRRRDPVARPPELAKVSIHHSVTPGTRVRLALLRVRNMIRIYLE